MKCNPIDEGTGPKGETPDGSVLDLEGPCWPCRGRASINSRDSTPEGCSARLGGAAGTTGASLQQFAEAFARERRTPAGQ